MQFREHHVRNRWRACVALMLALAPLVATAQAKSAKPPTTGVYRIAGTVVNGLTGAPMPRAVVEVLSVEDSHTVASVTSDTEGRFALDGLGEAKYQLVASKRGYRTAFYDEHEGFNTAIVTGPDQDTEHLTFRLSPGAVLQGIVTDDGGDPAEDARVMLFKQPTHHGQDEQVTLAQSNLTDDTGAYEFSNLEPGNYVVAVATQPWYALHKSDDKPADENGTSLDVAYPITYFDSATDEASASTIKLTGGSREEANVTMHAVPALHLSVATPNPVNGRIALPELRQFVFGLDVGTESVAETRALKPGNVEFTGVAPGHYELSEGDPPRIVDLDATVSEQIDPNAGTPTLAVTGSMRMASGAALPVGTRLVLTPRDRSHGHPENAEMQRGGRFSFPAIAPGTWTLSGEAGGSVLPVVAIGTGSETYAGNVLAVHDHALDIVATLGQGTTSVDGFAHKGNKGFAGAMIVLVPKETALKDALTRRDQSDSDGSFSLKQVIPGKYTVVAIENGWDLDWSKPEVIARYLTKGTAVTVTDNSGDVVHLAGPVAVQPR
jgi:Carboxypeptidase regulatory-like domain